MDRKRLSIAAMASTFLLLAACSSSPTREEIGTVGGAVIGGAAGHAIGGGSALGTVGGAAAGAILGKEIGENMDERRGRSCAFAGSTYSEGSVSCQSGYQYSCSDGTWISRHRGC